MLQKFLATLVLALCAILWTSAGARADVKVYSVMANAVKLRYSVPGGQVKEAGLAPRQQTTLPCREKQLELVVLDEKGSDLVKSTVGNQRFWIVSPGKDGQAVLTAAGEEESGRPLAKSIQIFNATGYFMSAHFFAISGDKRVADLSLPHNQACAPHPVPDATYTLYLKDEGGNPIGETYSYAKPGRFYVIFRKRGTLYDLETLGSIIAAP